MPRLSYCQSGVLYIADVCIGNDASLRNRLEVGTCCRQKSGLYRFYSAASADPELLSAFVVSFSFFCALT